MSMLASTVHPTTLQTRAEAIGLALIICGLIFELVRRRRLMERYAILWLLAGLTVLVLALWKGLLTTIAHGIGIDYAPTVLFAVAFVFVIVMLVQFSAAISRLADQNTILAQRLALLQQRLDGQQKPPEGAGSDDQAAGELADAALADEGGPELVSERMSPR